MTQPPGTSSRSRAPSHWLAALALVVLGAMVVIAIATQRWPEPVRAANAVGDSTCLSCHRDKAAFEGTAHRRTSRLATAASIAGSFRDGENVLRTANPALHFRLAADSAGFTQTAVRGVPPDTGTHTERFAYAIGSGRKGQTYLYWHGDELYELPVSYWTNVGWVSSPGYSESGDFSRPITPRCLECHATWIDALGDPKVVNRFRPAGEILGITCERCHASGRAHVENERSALHAVRGRAIVNPARLNRQQQLEGCAQCHGGVGRSSGASFRYVPGKRLADYITLLAPAPGAEIDVHGNQVALLARSKCFRSSAMTCSTCHDVHRTQRNTVELSGRCMTCHREQSCGLFPKEGHALAGRCVDCHMPLQTSNAIVSSVEGKGERPQVRNHWIRVYSRSAGQ